MRIQDFSEKQNNEKPVFFCSFGKKHRFLCEKSSFFFIWCNSLKMNDVRFVLPFGVLRSSGETYIFRLRKLSFYLPKDRLSPPERPCFATRNIYLSQTDTSKSGRKTEPKQLKKSKNGLFNTKRRKNWLFDFGTKRLGKTEKSVLCFSLPYVVQGICRLNVKILV